MRRDWGSRMEAWQLSNTPEDSRGQGSVLTLEPAKTHAVPQFEPLFQLRRSKAPYLILHFVQKLPPLSWGPMAAVTAATSVLGATGSCHSWGVASSPFSHPVLWQQAGREFQSPSAHTTPPSLSWTWLRTFDASVSFS